MAQGDWVGDQVVMTQTDNGDYSDLIRIKRLFCERVKPPLRRNSATKSLPALRWVAPTLCGLGLV
jgi:hypothetical protein